VINSSLAEVNIVKNYHKNINYTLLLFYGSVVDKDLGLEGRLGRVGFNVPPNTL